LLPGYLDVAHKGFVAFMAANCHDDHRIRTPKIFIGAE